MNRAVVLACDQNYAPYAILLAISIAEKHPGRDFDILIFSHEDINLPSRCAELGIIAQHITDTSGISASAATSRHGVASYLRLLIPGLIASIYHRILYLDSDIILSGQGLELLLNSDLRDHWVAAVRDNTQWRTPARHNREFRLLGKPNHPYFNAGVMLIDTDRWRTLNIQQRILGILADFPQAILYSDQSALNIVANGTWAEISPVWNWQYTFSSRFFADLVEPRILHFIGSNKPWKDVNKQLPARFRRFYSQGIRQHWPQLLETMKDLDGDAPAWPRNLRRSLLKHYLSLGAMKRYLDRFESPSQLIYHQGENRF